VWEGETERELIIKKKTEWKGRGDISKKKINVYRVSIDADSRR
jgi:hypothetical protein